MTDARNAYDEVSYPSQPYAQAHPDRLATMARLFGMTPARVQACRVLELGCGDGGNLIPMAYALPESSFTGVDLAARPIASGQATVAELELKNISLRQLDLLDVAEDFGEFDYIIAHGVYSWIPPRVRDKLLAISHAHLAPHGVAYISYNTYPGGHIREMVREMMQFHVRDLANPQEQINQARALIKFLSEAETDPNSYRQFLKDYLEKVLMRHESSLYHDDLAAINSPVLFHKFIAHAAQHGLQYLSEADFFEMQHHTFAPEVSTALQALSGEHYIVMEQYLDFIKCRTFRQTLLCRREVTLERNLKAERIKDFHLASPARPVSAEPDIASSKVEEFRGNKKAAAATDYPVAKAAILHLGEIWPRAIRFDDLLMQARARLNSQASATDESSVADSEVLSEILFQTFAIGLVELHTYLPPFVERASERPVASPLARIQIRNGDIVTTLRHAGLRVEDTLGRRLLMLLDGTRARAALLKELTDVLETEKAKREREGQPTEDIQQVLENLPQQLEKNLAELARLALLVS